MPSGCSIEKEDLFLSLLVGAGVTPKLKEVEVSNVNGVTTLFGLVRVTKTIRIFLEISSYILVLLYVFV